MDINDSCCATCGDAWCRAQVLSLETFLRGEFCRTHKYTLWVKKKAEREVNE